MRVRVLLLVCVAVAALCGVAAGAEEAPAAGPRVSFGLLADVQYADRDVRGSRHYRASLGKLEACVADLNSRDLDFAIQLGDLIDRGPESFAQVLPRYEALTGPRYHVLGNHDFPMPRGEVFRTLGMDAAHYTFSVGRWNFIILDTQDIIMGGGWPEESENYQQAKRWVDQLRAEGMSEDETCNRCGIGDAQKEWLRDTLRQIGARGERAIVFGHIPIAQEPREWGGIHNKDEIRQVLEDAYCVAAYFCGHAHEGGYVERGGIHYVVLQGMVETADTTAYATVDVYDDRIEVHGVGRATSRVLAISPTPALLLAD
jgi:manganese-dependent ADP-ribose/CDP-alcohol diphosphatase